MDKRLCKFMRILLTTNIVLFPFCGCKSDSFKQDASGDSYSNIQMNIGQDMLAYCKEDNRFYVLDYENMEQSLLCNKPNCRHTGNDCIMTRLYRNAPVFHDTCAYYFVDDKPEMVQDKDLNVKLKQGSNLCCYDFTTQTEKQLLHIEDASVSDGNGELLLHDDTLYYSKTVFHPATDENGAAVGFVGAGGDVSLAAIHLPDLKQEDLGSLYNYVELTKYYPMTPNSAHIFMAGLFDNRIYYNVAFVQGSGDPTVAGNYYYNFYVTYYDLSDGTYHGTPEDYEHIDFAQVMYLSDDYLVIRRDNQISVTKKGSDQQVTLTDESINDCSSISVFDDKVFCDGKIYDLNSKEVRESKLLKPDPELLAKEVITKYKNSFILRDVSQNFEKIPAEELLK
ncbi:MAG: hypothetical protein IJL32_08965 [Oscillospiraceae bacterium]|nr:hypothetical protein [Oscillospiraceae bacterium]